MDTTPPSAPTDGSADPDYRFSLANERTYLAWIRTSLALLAGGVALEAVVPDFGPPGLKPIAGFALVLLATLLPLLAYRRWRSTEEALRLGRSLPGPHLLRTVAGGLLVIGLIVAAMVLG